ncbi:hypothetical protein FNV43_RR27329 [Rhamnella rubrinervis]|uniref:Myb/SANT-like domain-containing protein n=1 Tax=Rhamnella rubrinervis TaxID=2594499 RepID=A0A8K0DR28_9ROSA|nr:hypothetical protein FNV43_RR27329 [Rhamnella rubrinervis]
MEKKILPILNAKFESQTTYKEYGSHMKWFRTRYTNYCQLMKNNSGFGWDPVTKKLTASNETWEEYFKSHPTHKSYCTNTLDYEDLKIAIGDGIAMGSHSIGLGDDTDARTFKVEDNRTSGLDDFEYDLLTETFIQSDAHDTLPQSPSLGLVEASGSHSDAINMLTQTITEFKQTIDSIDIRQPCCWDAIKENPNLDNHARFKALKLLNIRVKKMMFLKMTPEERSEWINFELEE